MSEERIPTVLLVDDNPNNLKVLAEVIESLGFEAAFAMNGMQTLEYIKVERPDLILMDVMMPEMDGYELCRIIKKQESIKDIPIIFVTAKAEANYIAEGFAAGGIDYITKPFNVTELKMRVSTHLELKRSRDDLVKSNEELKEALQMIHLKNAEYQEIIQKLDQASKTDALTGLYNRRFMVERMENELARYRRNSKVFCIVMFDIDFFKNINDTYGHECGDYVLSAVGGILKKSVREQDDVARWGGEEFLFLLPETDVNGAYALADKIRQTIQDKEFLYNENKIAITVTSGISECKYDKKIDTIIKNADDALYIGKERGRNCTIVNNIG